MVPPQMCTHVQCGIITSTCNQRAAGHPAPCPHVYTHTLGESKETAGVLVGPWPASVLLAVAAKLQPAEGGKAEGQVKG